MSCPLNITFFKNFLERVIATSIKRLCLEKKARMICEKCNIKNISKVIKCPINITGTLNILHKMFKYTIAICNLNSYQTFTK